MFNWEIHAEALAKTEPSTVWNIWKDVKNWPKWDDSLEWSRLDGAFEVGTKGTLKPKGWFPSQFTITESVKDASHSDTTYMPFTSLLFSHKVSPLNDKEVKIVHHVKASGLLAPLLWLTMRFQIRKSLPIALNNLVKLAEKR